MRIAITGAAGFLGWHARCALRARGGAEVTTVDRAEWADPAALDAAVRDSDVVLHLAGANRADPAEVREGNARLARTLVEALDRTGARPAVVYANSIHAGNGTPFGDGKQQAADVLLAWGERTGAVVADVRVPNLFGEQGRPHYNSVVATFCHELATGGAPTVLEDRELPLLHAQDAVAGLLAAADSDRTGTTALAGRPARVTEVLQILQEFRELYAVGDIPDIADPFRLALFNTYRSFTFPDLFPIRPKLRADQRGHLFECVRAHGGQGQTFCSTSHPGVTRGEHFHLRKVERFLVLAGRAEIALRRLFDDRIIRFEVSGGEPAIVDMPTMWVHNITNSGDGELLTMFWSHELLDPAAPDTYPELVDLPAEVPVG